MKRKNIKKISVCLSLALVCVAGGLSANILAAGKADEKPQAQIAPAELWEAEDSSLSLKSGGVTPDYAIEDGGIIVTSTMAGSSVSLKNPVDITGGTREIISLMPLLAHRGSADFRNFTIRMTDAYNSDIWMQVTYTNNQWWHEGYGTLVAVSTNSTEARGYKWGDRNEVDAFFEGCFISFSGITDQNEENTYLPMTFSYNNDTKTVYTMDHTRSLKTVMDLTDSDAIGYGNEWTGFESGMVNISVSANDFAGSQAQYLILSVCGESMAGEIFSDTKAPSLTVDVKEDLSDLPLAKVGKEYRFPSAFAADLKDGSTEVKTLVRAQGAEEYVEADGSFVPEKPGFYEVLYVSEDSAGNVAEKSYLITAAYDIPKLEIEFEETVTEIKAGTKTKLPKYTVNGGAGRTQIVEEVIRISDKESVEIKDDTFLPAVAGEYLYTVTAEDWNGAKQSASVLYSVTYGDGKPVVEGELMMYPKFVDGVTVELPLFDAYDVSFVPGVRVKAEQEITVYGTGDKAGHFEKLEGIKFTPSKDKFGDEVKIEYKIKSESGAEEIRTFTVPIITPEGVIDYFSADGFEIEQGAGSRLVFRTEKDSFAEFINPLNANNASIQFNVPSDLAAFEEMYVEFIDSENASLSVRISLKKRTDGGRELVFVDCGGKRYSMSGTLGGGTTLALRYNDETRTVSDYGGGKIFTVETYSDGSAFKGFPSGMVRLRFGFTGVSNGNAGLNLMKISNQTMGKTNDNGRYDYIKPSIEYSFPIDISVRFGAVTKLPAARLYDEFTPYMEVYLTVTSPSGKVLLDKVSGGKVNEFEVAERGAYLVEYTGQDSAGNVLYSSYVVRSEDIVAPTVALSVSEITGKVGEEIVLPEAIVQDDVDEEVSLTIFVVNSRSETKMVEERKFIPEEAGKYTVRYFAMDSSYNCTIAEISLIVE